jgi:2-oxoglutarate dehydrogenase complex dihydrolipoamide succinyltransferase (E2) component
MEFKLVVPSLGESVVDGTVVKWIKYEGDKIKVDEPLVEIMTDKINIEIPSPYDGVLVKHLAPVDSVVAVGQELALLDIAEDAAMPHAGEAVDEIPQEAAEEKTEVAVYHRDEGIHANENAIESGIEAAKASPVVRRLAREHFIDLRKVKGSGKGGRVTKKDVIQYIDARHSVDTTVPEFKFPDVESEEVIPVTGVRKVISEHMVNSAFTIPHVTTFDEADMSALIAWRKKNVDKIEEEHGVRVTFMPFIAKAMIFAARKFPWINATLEDNVLTVKKYFNIGIAVARDNSLIVPVVKNCESKSILSIAREMRELTEKANADTLQIDEISGGTISITNAGGMGALASTPIIAKPQVAILGVHKIVKKPVVVDDEIVIRPIINFGLSFDHRVVDGAYAVQYLRRMIEYLENPDEWLVDVI